jgi:Tfp pilus assembly protein PilO
MTKMRQWSALTGVAVAAILLAGWFLLVAPKRGEAADLREQKTAQEQQNRQMRTQLAVLTAQDKKLPAQRARLAQIAAQLPDNPALPALVRSLTDAAGRTGVDIVSMAPGQPTTAPTTPGSPGGSPTAANGQLAWIPVTLQAHGGYFQLEAFLHRLETLRRAYLVTGVSLAPGAKLQPGATNAGAGGRDTWTGTIVATITGRVFVVSNRVALPAAPPSAAAR